jgi:hypothetical protein
MWFRGTSLLGLGLLVVSACGVGDDGPPSTPEPRTCLAHLALTGTFTMSQASPDNQNNNTGDPPGDGIPDIQGCWPVGVWTFTASVVDNTCAAAPELQSQYKFTGVFVPDPVTPDYTFTLNAPDPNTMHHRVGVSEGGGALCSGSVELYSDDGLKSWILDPALNVFNTSGPLTGQGEYAEWTVAQYP